MSHLKLPEQVLPQEGDLVLIHPIDRQERENKDFDHYGVVVGINYHNGLKEHVVYVSCKNDKREPRQSYEFHKMTKSRDADFQWEIGALEFDRFMHTQSLREKLGWPAVEEPPKATHPWLDKAPWSKDAPVYR